MKVVRVQPVLDFVDGNGISYYIDMDGVQSAATSEEGYGDWPGADYLLSSSMYALLGLIWYSSVPVPSMTYNVFGGTLNLAQSNPLYSVLVVVTI